jgi:hypothetical protein
MLDHTGNPIYPLYWNYLVIGRAEWAGVKGPVSLTADLLSIRFVSRALMVLFSMAFLLIFTKKIKSYLFLLLGFVNLVFAFSIFGFSVYLAGFSSSRVKVYAGHINKLWIGKLFAFPWNFLGVLAIIFLLYFLPKKIGKLGTVFGALLFLIGLTSAQLIWPSIDKHYLQLQGQLQLSLEANREIAKSIADNYTGRGKIILPAQAEIMTYYLANNEQITGEKLMTSFYSPFYYYQGDDPFSEWETFRQEIINWLQKENVELFVVTRDKTLNKMFEREEGKLFEYVGPIRSESRKVCDLYKVIINEQ